MYAASLSIVGVQAVLANVYDIELTNLDGVPITSSVVGFLSEDEFNERTASIVAANFTTNSTYYDRIETFTTGAAFVAWELVTLLTGTYIFNFLYLMGMPIEFVTAFLMLYLLLLARAIIGLVRGI